MISDKKHELQIRDRWHDNETVQAVQCLRNAVYRAIITTSDNSDSVVVYLLASVNDLFEYALQNLSDGGMVGMSIKNRVNQND